MKYVLLAILVLFAAQPVQASACDMHDGQNSSHSQHGNMHDDNDQAMDCCADEPTDMDENCGSMDQCGACPASLAAVKPSIVSIIFNSGSNQFLAASNAPMCRFSSPPFRPPIS
jgi:hypothetical protein